MSIAMQRDIGGASFYRNMFRKVIRQLGEVVHDMETDGLDEQAEMLKTTIGDLSGQYEELTAEEPTAAEASATAETSRRAG